MQTMRRIGVQINGKLVGSCDSISKVSSPLFKDILDPWFDIEGFVPEKPSLNENQQIVLEWLKEVYTDNDEGYFSVISYLTKPTTKEEVHDPAHIALACLNPDEEVQVLAAFAEWALEQEED